MNSDDQIMTVSQVADYLQISEITTYKLIQEEKLPAFKVGRHWRVVKADLKDFIEKQKKGERF
ncbi:MAG: DNA-binding protein [Firmicutes bacterium HGW-Firmicutes-15]|nr:MAG: DNA-binding protein [Firmicutes bacterium HGW-Firmicutes-15]